MLPTALLLALALACTDKPSTGGDGDGGTGDGGATDGGVGDGGTGDGGTTDGGTTDGGTTDGGTTDGGTTDGGTTDGGTTDGGTTLDPDGPVTAVVGGHGHGDVDQFSRPVEGSGATRVVSLDRAADGPGGTVQVTVDLVGPTTLVLLNQQDVAWEVDQTSSHTLRRIVWGCTAGSTLAGPHGLETVVLDDPTLCGRTDWLDFDMRRLEHELDALGLPVVASTHAVDQADSLRIEGGLDWWADGSFADCVPLPEAEPVQPPDTTWVAERCPDLAKDSAVCVLLDDAELILAGVDSGETCRLRDAPSPIGDGQVHGSAEWSGIRVFAAREYDLLTGISLIDEEWHRALVYGTAVAMHDGQLLLRPDLDAPDWAWTEEGLAAWDSFQQAQCEAETADFYPDPSSADEVELDVAGGVAYVAGATGVLALLDVETGADLGSLALEGAGAIQGLSVVDEERLAVLSASTGALTIYDLATGQEQARHSMGSVYQGIACATVGTR